jgi:hypothetical protein
MKIKKKLKKYSDGGKKITIKTGTSKRNPETNIFEKDIFQISPKKEVLPKLQTREYYDNFVKSKNYKYELNYPEQLSIDTAKKIVNIPNTYGTTNSNTEAYDLYNKSYKEDESYLNNQVNAINYYDKQFNWLKGNMENPKYAERLKKEFENNAETVLLKRKNNLLNSPIDVNVKSRFWNPVPETPNVQPIYEYNYNEDIGEDVKTKTDKNRLTLLDPEYAKSRVVNGKKIIPTLAIHEGQHLITDQNKGMSDYAKNLYNDSYLPTNKKDNNQYYNNPTEMDARKKALDFDMEKLGIKKYEEDFKPKHYKKILKLKNKLNDDSLEFLEHVKPKNIQKIFNTIAYNDLQEQIPIAKNGGSLKKYPNGGREPIVVNDPRDERLHSYLDSLNLYNSYQTQLKYNPPQDVNKSLAAKYLKPGTEAYNNNVNARQIFNKNSPAKNAKYFKNVTSDYWNSEAQFKKDVPEDAPLIDAYKKLSFSTPTKTGLWTTPDLYNSSIAPVDIYFGGQKPESSAWNPIYKKPVQPYAYSGNSTDYEQYRSSPTIVGTNRIFKPVNNLPNTKTTSTLTSIPTIVKNRPKENITTLSQEQRLLPETEKHLEFDPIGLKKGTYFTRPRQQQEQSSQQFGREKLVDYFDNKTGKLLKTMEFGGNITRESEWELVNEDLPKAGNGLSLVKTLTPIGNKVIPRNPSLYKDAINNVDKIEHNINDRYRVQADDFTDKNYPTDYDEDSGHNDYVDALRHSATAMYTTSGQGNFLAPLKVPYTNVMGLAHELKGLGSYVSNPDKLTWQGAKQQLRETGSDLYNNFVGSMIGGLPINIENKEKILKFAKDKNILSDLSKKQNGGKLPKRRLNLNKSSDWEIVD